MDGDETGRKKFSPDSQPMRCTRATDCPVAARHGNAALWPCPWPRLCTSNQSLFQSTVPNYLSRNPQIFLQTFLSLANKRDYQFVRGACFYLPVVKNLSRGLTMKIGGGGHSSRLCVASTLRRLISAPQFCYASASPSLLLCFSCFT